jgi:hypothetical protein
VVILGGVFLVAGVIAVAIWTETMRTEPTDDDRAIEHRALRYAELADAAERLGEELGREPSVRENYASIEPVDESEDDTVVESA